MQALFRGKKDIAELCQTFKFPIIWDNNIRNIDSMSVCILCSDQLILMREALRKE